jgi:hypothetical protein
MKSATLLMVHINSRLADVLVERLQTRRSYLTV